MKVVPGNLSFFQKTIYEFVRFLQMHFICRDKATEDLLIREQRFFTECNETFFITGFVLSETM